MCIELHRHLFALEDRNISRNLPLLLSGNQVKEIKSKFIEYKEGIEANDKFCHLSMC